MDIVIFKDLTTSDQVQELKKEAEKYTGLYVDMNEPEQRKYVKEKADLINQLLKKVDRKRIDAAKEYKLAVEKEAASITEDLNIANMPFTLLIDEHKAERKKILDAEKARKQAILDAEQYELDHEMAILMNIKFEADKAQAEKEKAEYEAKLKADAIKEQAAQAERDRINAEAREAQQKQSILDSLQRERDLAAQAESDKKQAAIDAEQARLKSIEDERLAGIERQRLAQKAIDDEAAARAANIEHLKKINNEALDSLLKVTTLPAEQLKMIIRAVAKNEISHIKINY